MHKSSSPSWPGLNLTSATGILLNCVPLTPHPRGNGFSRQQNKSEHLACPALTLSSAPNTPLHLQSPCLHTVHRISFYQTLLSRTPLKGQGSGGLSPWHVGRTEVVSSQVRDRDTGHMLSDWTLADPKGQEYTFTMVQNDAALVPTSRCVWRGALSLL